MLYVLQKLCKNDNQNIFGLNVVITWQLMLAGTQYSPIIILEKDTYQWRFQDLTLVGRGHCHQGRGVENIIESVFD